MAGNACAYNGCIPRERALTAVIRSIYPSLANLSVHESSPCGRGASLFLERNCGAYIASQFFPDEPPGATVQGWRNENLERQTFPDHAFDLVVTQDVMEHVFDPAAVFREVSRTLKPGGYYVFTAPTYKALLQSERQAQLNPDGSIRHLAEPEYHGSPIGSGRSLVTYHYGYDLPELIKQWSGMDVEVRRFHDHGRGIIGEFTEVYVCVTPLLRGSIAEKTSGPELQALACSQANAWEASPYYDDAERWTWLFWSDAHAFKPLFDELDLKRVVELACGHGRHGEYLLQNLRNRLGDLVMMDVLESNVAYCRQRLGQQTNVSIMVNNGADFRPLETCSVTAIFCYDAMVHFDRRVVLSYLQDASRVLMPGGKALFHHSNCDVDPDSNFASNPHARAFMSGALFSNYAQRCGLEVLQQRIMDWGKEPSLDCLTLLAKPDG
jgi:SAM-dependent methyltransferase